VSPPLPSFHSALPIPICPSSLHLPASASHYINTLQSTRLPIAQQSRHLKYTYTHTHKHTNTQHSDVSPSNAPIRAAHSSRTHIALFVRTNTPHLHRAAATCISLHLESGITLIRHVYRTCAAGRPYLKTSMHSRPIQRTHRPLLRLHRRTAPRPQHTILP
jgi:hypothetical protein